MVWPQPQISTERLRHFGKWRHSLYLHAEELQQSREDAHVVEEEDIVSRPVEDVCLGVTLVKHTFIHTQKQEKTRNRFFAMIFMPIKQVYVQILSVIFCFVYFLFIFLN